jgi:hypothetical protein
MFAFPVLLSLVFWVSAADVEAKHHGKQDYGAHFGDMDASGDDMVDMAEFEKYFPKAEEKMFKEADGNGDGKIDHDEWHEFKEKYGYGHKEGEEGHREGYGSGTKTSN